MNDNENRSKTDRILDEIMAIACDEYQEEMMNQIPPDEEIDYEFSNDFYKKRDQLMKKHKVGKYENYRSPAFKVAVFFGVLFIGATSLTLSVEALRVRVFNFVINLTEEYAEININEKGDVGEAKLSVDEYLPDGFVLEENDSNESDRTITYRSDNNYLHYSFYTLEGKLAIDSEEADFYQTEINGYEVVISDKGDFCIFVWHDKSYMYNIVSDLPKIEIQKIVENILQN